MPIPSADAVVMQKSRRDKARLRISTSEKHKQPNRGKREWQDADVNLQFPVESRFASKNLPRIPYALGDSFAIQVLQQRNRIFATYPRQFFEAANVNLWRFRFLRRDLLP